MGCGWFKQKLPCFKSIKKPLVDSPVKLYSWDQKDDLNKKDFIIENLNNQTVTKAADSIKGQQFIIQNCKGCSIFLMDHSASVTIDDCTECFIFVAPVKTSCFIRDSADCILVVACQQLRTRDCKGVQVHLCCTSQPSIEASTHFSFQCYQCNYPLISEHFSKAGLNEYNNNWSNIHDFTPSSHNNLNYVILPEDSTYEDQLQGISETSALSASHETSFIPFTHAPSSLTCKEACLVVFFKKPFHKAILSTFLKTINKEGCVLVRSREMEGGKASRDRLFPASISSKIPPTGNMICLEMVGERASFKCSRAVDLTREMMKNTSLRGYVGKGNVIGGGGGVVEGIESKGIEDIGMVYVTTVLESEATLNNFRALIKSQMGF